ncbi:MAG: MinD/ParA family protein [Spirochaetaceae bacterium]|nr:MAG: MinD/ParA family protein [Spirochaetaceae bacterium]
MQIVPVAGGKGGVGKSLVATNLAIGLGQAGKRVVLADLDLGGSNLHLMLGVNLSGTGIGSFITSEKKSFADIVVETEYENVSFIAGDNEIPGIANLTTSQKRMLISRLRALDTEYLILDLGAGSSFNVMDFFLMSGRGLIVTSPTPTATVNAYVFLKNVMFRILNNSFKKKSAAAAYLESLRKDGSPELQRVYIPAVIEKVKKIDPESHAAYIANASRFVPRLVMNMVEDPRDADKANRLRRSCQQYLGIDLEYYGVIYRDDLQDIALGSKLPIIVYKPNSVLAQGVYRIADKMIEDYALGEQSDGESPLEYDGIDESYEEAGMQAAADFEAKMEYVEELLHTGALSTGDLVETVKSQQIEIQHLKKENALLKSKIVKAIGRGVRI